MPLRAGDIVSLSIRPPLKLSDYQFTHAGATLTRRLSEAVKTDVKDMRVELRKLYRQVLRLELTTLNELSEALASSDLEGLLRFIDSHAKIENTDGTKTTKKKRRAASRS